MSTRSNVGIINPNGDVKVVYVHYDGYPSGVGKELEKNHNSEAAARALLSGTQIRTIQGGVQFFDDGTTASMYPSLDAYMDSMRGNCFIEYVYLWSNGRWMCKDPHDHSRGFMSVEDAVETYENNYR